MVTGPSPALESKLLVKDERKRAFSHPQLSTLPRTGGEDLLWTERSQFTLRPLDCEPWGKALSFIPLLCWKAFASGGGCMCMSAHTGTMHAPSTWALRWRLSFLWNRFPGVGLLGQRAYVFLISMDFSWLISKKAVIIYIFTSND